MHPVSAVLVLFVMCACSYVSFVEILSTKAVEGFAQAGYGQAQAQRYACFAFFAGLMATWLLGKAVQLVSSGATGWRKHRVSRGSSWHTNGSSSNGYLAAEKHECTLKLVCLRLTVQPLMHIPQTKHLVQRLYSCTLYKA
jgi:hypothetical protein